MNPQVSIGKLLLFVLFASLGLIQCTNKAEPEPEFRLRASLLTNDDHTWNRAFVHFADILAERSAGRLKLEIYASEQLAKELEAIRLIQAGVIDMTITSSTLNNWMDIAAFCELPFLLKDSVDMKALINGPVGKRIDRDMIALTGLRPLCYFQRGPRHLTSNRPIRHPDDLKGLIIRVPSVPSFVTAWSAMGAKPTPMAFSEVFTSLQQGTIEAQENPFAMIRSAGFAEVQKYVNLTEHVVSWVYPVVGEKQFQALPPDLQEIFLQAAKEMQAYEHSLFIKNEKAVQQELRDKGMELIEVDKAAFSAKCRKAIFESLTPEMQVLYNEFMESLE